jgi:hypothetical protein
MMKSLRKTALLAGVVLLTLGLAFVPLRARTRQPRAQQQGSAAPAQSQTPPPPAQQQPPLRVQVNQVIVPVTDGRLDLGHRCQILT